MRASCGRNISADPARAAQELVAGFAGVRDMRPGYRSALVMTDALAGHADRLVDELTVATAGQYQFFGGSAGDNANFQKTMVFCGGEVLSDAAAALEIISEKPIGVGVSHGWEPASEPFRVTEANGMKLVSLNGLPAAEVFQAHSADTGQTLDPDAALRRSFLIAVRDRAERLGELRVDRSMPIVAETEHIADGQNLCWKSRARISDGPLRRLFVAVIETSADDSEGYHRSQQSSGSEGGEGRRGKQVRSV